MTTATETIEAIDKHLNDGFAEICPEVIVTRHKSAMGSRLDCGYAHRIGLNRHLGLAVSDIAKHKSLFCTLDIASVIIPAKSGLGSLRFDLMNRSEAAKGMDVEVELHFRYMGFLNGDTGSARTVPLPIGVFNEDRVAAKKQPTNNGKPKNAKRKRKQKKGKK